MDQSGGNQIAHILFHFFETSLSDDKYGIPFFQKANAVRYGRTDRNWNLMSTVLYYYKNTMTTIKNKRNHHNNNNN